MSDKSKRTRKTQADILQHKIYKHSPLKHGLKVKDENEVYHEYDKILPRLYLGNIEASKDKKMFETKKIKAVLNCSKDIPHSFIKNADVEYMRIPVDDSLKDIDIKKMYEFANIAAEFIHKHVDIQKHNMLVHCYAGRQRSAICIAFYLLKYHNMTPEQAYKFIIDKRPESFHFGSSLNFNTSLLSYYKNLIKK